MREKPKLPYIPKLKPYPTRGMTLGVRLGSELAGVIAAGLALYSTWIHVFSPSGPGPHPILSAVWFFYLTFFVSVCYSAGGFTGALVGAAVDKARGEWE
jgi:hypothetical protein